MHQSFWMINQTTEQFMHQNENFVQIVVLSWKLITLIIEILETAISTPHPTGENQSGKAFYMYWETVYGS